MAFAQKLARNVNAYGAETQQLMQEAVATIKNDFMQCCENASNAGKCSFSRNFCVEAKVENRQDYSCEKMRDLLKEGLADLGLQRCDCEVHPSGLDSYVFQMSATWTADAETSRKGESINPCSGGTRVTCPICHEHRPAVALVPCGHVVCRDCHRSKQLRQCPMCRKVITSATQGLFMD